MFCYVSEVLENINTLLEHELSLLSLLMDCLHRKSKQFIDSIQLIVILSS